MTYDEYMTSIQAIARFESLVHLPDKKDPDWPKWSAAATKGEVRVMGKGETAVEALTELLDELNA